MGSTGSSGERAPAWVRAVGLVLAGLLAVYVGSLTLTSDPGYDVLFDGVVANLAYGVPGVLAFARAATARRHGLPYALLGAAMLVQTAGNVLYVVHVQYLDPVPYPSAADVAYLLVYPLLLAAVVTLARPDVGRAQRHMWLDGLIAALGTAAGGAVLGLRAILPRLEGDLPALLTNAAYPVLDLVLACLVVAVITVRGRRPSTTWLWLGAGLLLYAVGDSFYLYRVAQGTFHAGTVVDASWAGALAMMAVASWQVDRDVAPVHRIVSPADGSVFPVGRNVSPADRNVSPADRNVSPADRNVSPVDRNVAAPAATGAPGTTALVVPSAFSLVAVGVLVAGTRASLPAYVVALAASTLLAVLARTALAFRALHALAESRRQARTDELTGLANRRWFTEHLQSTLEADARGFPGGGTTSAAVALLDLDGFKEVNDSLGHHVGDEMLRQIGPRLVGTLRPGDALARLGGDEFALVLPRTDVAEATELARRMCLSLSAPFVVDDVTVRVGGSIGIAMHPDHASEGHGLLQCADIAMYAAKAARIGVSVYDPSRDVHSRERLEMMQQLRLALDSDQVELHYQPQVDLCSGQVRSVEALVRWRHPERGLLYPDAFLDLVEQTGQMWELTITVLDLALRQCADWRSAGHDLTVAVNLSAGNLLEDRLPATVQERLSRHRLPASALVLEITEDMLMTDPERARENLRALRALGVALSVDDYGTGYGSLEYLRDLPVHELKLDRTFVRHLAAGSADAAIVTSTVQLAHALGLRMVAEGVEDDQALELLRSIGADVAQGYHLCRPHPAPVVTDWLRDRQRGALATAAAGARAS